MARTVRLLRENDALADIVITSHDPRYEVSGARRYEPRHNHLEIDRFTEELIENDACFLYGDTFYSEQVIKKIVQTPAEKLLFFGNERSIVAIKVADGALFFRRFLDAGNQVDRVRELFLAGKIEKCIGWQVYQSFEGLPFGEKTIAADYILIQDGTEDFNSPEDYNRRTTK